MSFNISDEIKRTFDLASLKHQAAKDFTSQEWKAYRKIGQKYDDMRRYEQRTYEIEYKTRFEVARKRLVNKAGSKSKDFKHRWFGGDQFDKSAINRQAQRNVRNSHYQLMAGIDKQEARETGQLLDTCKKQTELREKPKRDFSNASDRRGQNGLPKDRRQTRIRQQQR